MEQLHLFKTDRIPLSRPNLDGRSGGMNILGLPAKELFANGRVYSCGTYYPRQHKRHWRCSWSQAVWKCKQGNARAIRECSRVLAELMDETLPCHVPYVITFVPNEPSRLAAIPCFASTAERLATAAFNTLRDRRELTFIPLLEPSRPKTKKQHRCRSQWERRGNMVDYFIAPRPELVFGKTIVVVDDVLTSGATLRECERVLLRAGALDVLGFVLARTVGW